MLEGRFCILLFRAWDVRLGIRLRCLSLKLFNNSESTAPLLYHVILGKVYSLWRDDGCYCVEKFKSEIKILKKVMINSNPVIPRMEALSRMKSTPVLRERTARDSSGCPLKINLALRGSAHLLFKILSTFCESFFYSFPLFLCGRGIDIYNRLAERNYNIYKRGSFRIFIARDVLLESSRERCRGKNKMRGTCY